ncbi:MAG: T9SS type A sorting domain-containing protein [Candidatus Poribacteria bacterium]|nr:T9SS type A sorting domain-containing protein [Candidatus Poribacteria bacterium]
MHTQIKIGFLFYTFTLFICLNSFFLMHTDAQVLNGPGVGSASENYTFKTIDVPGVEFLAVTASSDFEDYAGYTKSADGEKEVAFTLIDGVFTTYDFPGSQKTHFYALGNNGQAAGYYQDRDGLHHGVVLEDGKLGEYNFPGAVETFIFGISDATGVLTGNFIDADGVRRGFTGDIIVEAPGATATYADFINSSGSLVGSYIDAEGIFHPYVRSEDDRYISFDLPNAENLEFYYFHGTNDARNTISRAKVVGDVTRSYVGVFGSGLREVKFPGSVSTEGWNVNQDGSVVGHYDSPDGRRHGFIARPINVRDKPVFAISGFNYTFETIDVPGIEFLAVTASSDFEDYAGYTRSPDGEKEVAFTLIDGVFATYDFPGSQKTHFYALSNNGVAAGHYQDSDGLYHGVILENGELRQYDFPSAVETQIFSISDATGALTGNFIDASGVRRGFTADEIIEAPGALATYADFINAEDVVAGSYIDADGLFHTYRRSVDGGIITFVLPTKEMFEFFFVHGFTDTRISLTRGKLVDDVPRTYVGSVFEKLHELKFPGSVSTAGYNINQDGSVVGHYDSPDGRRHGFIARLATEAESTHFGNFYTVHLSRGLNMLSVPLAPPTPMTAKALVAMTGATTIITLDTAKQHFVAWTPNAPDDGFTIEGGKGYIVNVPETRNFVFVGAPWTDVMKAAAASPAIATQAPQEAWAFVVSGHLADKSAFDGYTVIVRNLRTNTTVTTSVQGDYFAAATADLERRSVVRVGDVVEVRVIGPNGNFESQTHTFKVTPEHLANAVLYVRFDGIAGPTQNLLLQNYPNPFNPETWIPYQLSEPADVTLTIYAVDGKVVRHLDLGHQSASMYQSRSRAAYWDGKNAVGEPVASGVYFYTLTADDFTATRKMLIRK